MLDVQLFDTLVSELNKVTPRVDTLQNNGSHTFEIFFLNYTRVLKNHQNNQHGNVLFGVIPNPRIFDLDRNFRHDLSQSHFYVKGWRLSGQMNLICSEAVRMNTTGESCIGLN